MLICTHCHQTIQQKLCNTYTMVIQIHTIHKNSPIPHNSQILDYIVISIRTPPAACTNAGKILYIVQAPYNYTPVILS